MSQREHAVCVGGRDIFLGHAFGDRQGASKGAVVPLLPDRLSLLGGLFLLLLLVEAQCDAVVLDFHLELVLLLLLSRRPWAKTSCSHLGGRPSCKSSGQQRPCEGPQKYGRRSLVRGGPSCLLLLLLWLCFVLLLFVRSSLVRVFVIAWLVGCSSKVAVRLLNYDPLSQ